MIIFKKVSTFIPHLFKNSFILIMISFFEINNWIIDLNYYFFNLINN